MGGQEAWDERFPSGAMMAVQSGSAPRVEVAGDALPKGKLNPLLPLPEGKRHAPTLSEVFVSWRPQT